MKFYLPKRLLLSQEKIVILLLLVLRPQYLPLFQQFDNMRMLNIVMKLIQFI